MWTKKDWALVNSSLLEAELKTREAKRGLSTLLRSSFARSLTEAVLRLEKSEERERIEAMQASSLSS